MVFVVVLFLLLSLILDALSSQVNSVGVISTIAGNAMAGYTGDGGMASLARLAAAGDASLHSPEGVAMSSTMELYIAETNNHRIRKV